MRIGTKPTPRWAARGGAENETARLRRCDQFDLLTRGQLSFRHQGTHSIDGRAEGGTVSDQRSDVLESNSRLGKVGNFTDVISEVDHGAILNWGGLRHEPGDSSPPGQEVGRESSDSSPEARTNRPDLPRIGPALVASEDGITHLSGGPQPQPRASVRMMSGSLPSETRPSTLAIQPDR